MGTEVVDQIADNEFVDLSDDVDELDRDRKEPEELDGDADETGGKDAGEDKDEEGEKEGEGDDAGEKGGEGEGEEGAGGEGEGEGEDEIAPPVDKTKEEISSLRQMVRAQRNQLKDLEGQLKKQNAALVDKDIIAEDELAPEDAKINEQRSEVLDQMVELMELNPKFEDVKSVCTQSNFDDVTETLARAYIAEHGGDEVEVAGQIAEAVWSKANPYKEMYGLVKQYHPDFAGKESDSGVGNKLEQAKNATKGKKEAAPSLSSLPGSTGGKSGSGWTSQRIDQLSEEELNDVPSDIYDKYMMGTLD